MAKKNKSKQQPTKKAVSTPAATTAKNKGKNPTSTTETTATSTSWTSIPGKRLHVDISGSDRPPQDLEHETEDLSKWTSRHYDDDYDFDGDGDYQTNHNNTNDSKKKKNKNSSSSTKTIHAEDDLFDPDPHAPTNKFDSRSKFEGAHDAGMFYSLEVIPGDMYEVVQEDRRGRTATEGGGDDDGEEGKICRVIFKQPSDLNQLQGDMKHPTQKQQQHQVAESKDNNDSEETATKTKNDALLSKKEKLKAKRKAKREERKLEAKRRKLQQREQSDEGTSCTDTATSCTSEQQDQQQQLRRQQQEEEEEITNLQTTWSISAPGLTLHPTLARGLRSMNYAHPTPIQSATLPAAILGRRDIVGAAPTGSGKTLSFGIPILTWLLEQKDGALAAPTGGGGDDDGDGHEGNGGMNDKDEIDPDISAENTNSKESESKPSSPLPLQALILTPTRELAMQVTGELQRVCCKEVKIGTIVGGFAEVKQKRILEKMRPEVLVGTPGRLWELMSSNDYPHLNNLSQLRFLVIDEADRMIKQGSFPQLQQIFQVVIRANPPPVDSDTEDESDTEEDGYGDDDMDRLKGLQGVRGEAKVVMLNDSILEAIEKQKTSMEPKAMEMEEEEYWQERERILQQQEEEEEEEDVSDAEGRAERVHRQTFVYSATLTLPPSTHHLIKKDASDKVKTKKKGKKQPTTVDGAIAEILKIAGAMGETKVVDLSNVVPEGTNQQSKKPSKDGKSDEEGRQGSKKGKKEKDEPKPITAARLPPGLSLGEIQCAQRHKDSHLYAYLVTTQQGSSGPCLVFCNSIAAVRRVGETLKTLGLPAKTLHAQMAQKSRLAALESLKTPKSRAIVVATDVAARGLDIASVSTVIHYDVARMVDTFIHRAGRTARGVGEKAVGTSISLVAPAEEREHHKICEAVKGSGVRTLGQVHVDGRLLSAAQERVSLATKIVACNDIESQATKKNKWLRDAAEEAGLELDDDMMEGGLLDGDQRDRQRFLEAKRAKIQLRELLAVPIRKQRFGKFLSGAGLQDAIATEKEVKPYVVDPSSAKRKNRMRKRARA